MRRHSIIATVALVATVGLASGAIAARHKHHSVSLTSKLTGIYMTKGPGSGPPIAAQEAGLFKGTLGTGVVGGDVNPRAGTGTFEFFNRKGSFHGPFLIKSTPGPGPGVDTISGTLTITGGTGEYAHAHGKLKLTGNHNKNTRFTMLQETGTLTY